MHFSEGKLCSTCLHQCGQGVHVPSFGHELVGGYITKSVTQGQCDANLWLASQLQNLTAVGTMTLIWVTNSIQKFVIQCCHFAASFLVLVFFLEYAN